ncbi:MAG: DUF971 domain-containing protein [Myxococcota bacterium]
MEAARQTAKVEPTTVRAPKGARLLEIDWSDGSTTYYRHRVLRGFCPCAICQGHSGAIDFVDVPEGEGLELVDIAEAGQYALRLGWGDGHRTGIYSFGYLRDLASLYDLSEDEARAHTFPRP